MSALGTTLMTVSLCKGFVEQRLLQLFVLSLYTTKSSFQNVQRYFCQSGMNLPAYDGSLKDKYGCTLKSGLAVTELEL